jgi:hypothetical protein
MALLALPMAAQDQPKPEEKPAPPKKVQRLVTLKYADAFAVRDLLRVFPVNIQVDRAMRVIALDGIEAAVDTAVQAIKELDVPAAAQKNIELTVYYLNGSDSEDASGSAPPADLANVIIQLKGTLPFKQYRLTDVLRLRIRDGQNAETSSVAGSADLGGTKQPIITRFKIKSASVSPDGTTVHIDGLSSSSRVPVVQGGSPGNYQFTYIDVGLNTDIDIKEGQKAVVGRAGLERDKALFLVLTAQVVQ